MARHFFFPRQECSFNFYVCVCVMSIYWNALADKFQEVFKILFVNILFIISQPILY